MTGYRSCGCHHRRPSLPWRAASAMGINSPAGANRSAASSLGAAVPDAPAQATPSVTRELLGLRVTGPGKGIDIAPLVTSHLSDDVGGRSETINAEPPRRSRHCQRPIADESRAQQRSSLGITISGWNRKTKALVSNRVLGVAAIDLVACETAPAHTGFPVRFYSSGTRRSYSQARVYPRGRRPRVAQHHLPSPATTPTISCPGTSGNLGSVNSPSTICRSVRQTPHART